MQEIEKIEFSISTKEKMRRITIVGDITLEDAEHVIATVYKLKYPTTDPKIIDEIVSEETFNIIKTLNDIEDEIKKAPDLNKYLK